MGGGGTPGTVWLECSLIFVIPSDGLEHFCVLVQVDCMHGKEQSVLPYSALILLFSTEP